MVELIVSAKCFVTIRIFARTELTHLKRDVPCCFVTIRIFARTEQKYVAMGTRICFVTIRIFARTERILSI